MTDTQLNIATLVGSALSLVGVVVAIWQIVKTRRAAEEAERATVGTVAAVSRQVLLSDMTACSANLEALMDLMRARRYEAASVRVAELMRQLNHLKGLPSPEERRKVFTELLTQLHVIRSLLDRKLDNDDVVVNTVDVIRVLARVADEVNGWVGHAKYSLPEPKHDS